jgi:predicted nucleotidyltransferase
LEIKKEAEAFLKKCFLKCEEKGFPLVAAIGFGSCFDLRQGLSSQNSDIDVLLIPFIDNREKTTQVLKLCDGLFDEEKRGGNISVVRSDISYAYDFYGDWIKEAEDPKAFPGNFWMGNLTRGAEVIASDQTWAKILEEKYGLKEKGVKVRVR